VPRSHPENRLGMKIARRERFGPSAHGAAAAERSPARGASAASADAGNASPGLGVTQVQQKQVRERMPRA
jgi:hypothetical protein